MYTFEQLQLKGLEPSLLANRIGIPIKNLKLFLAKIRVTDSGCWEWMAAKSGGYGVVKIRSIRSSFLQAHRLAYELVHGPVDIALDMHHKVEKGCMGPHCVNPAHLMPVTRRQHLVELTPGCASFEALNRNGCVNGHEYTIESTRVLKNGMRQCRICDKGRAQAARDAARGDKPKFKKTKLATHCKRGHPLEGDNLYFYDTKWGKQRACRACREERKKEAAENPATE